MKLGDWYSSYATMAAQLDNGVEREQRHGYWEAALTSRFADRAEFLQRIATADIVINVRAYSVFDDEALAHARRLKSTSATRDFERPVTRG